ncbi:hypothetical protein TEA_013863 [Camellia sinensis var. sinensis]|uniref:Phosphatidic acid phosphatase type 2/haloperoxidase domain-containing protein n=1 Tax=Camellia sinensis var. sinensis TaxID=542762 RepID=A0A4S4DXJ1_CAMSN|nr:hypothetical protein TEA_013863 [Camellia sinensis var. sinensis]
MKICVLGSALLQIQRCSGSKLLAYRRFGYPHTGSFAGLGFLSWYLSGKIRVFDRRGHIAKLCIVILPYLLASLVGVSRVDDYWHHWTDVFTGGIIGMGVSSLCYLHFFPYPHDMNGWAPHAYFRTLAENAAQSVPTEMEAAPYAHHVYGEETEKSTMLDTSPDLGLLEAGKTH